MWRLDHRLSETRRIALTVPKRCAELCSEFTRRHLDAALRRECPVDRFYQDGDVINTELHCKHHGISTANGRPQAEWRSLGAAGARYDLEGSLLRLP
jgi:hypothetical protein